MYRITGQHGKLLHVCMKKEWRNKGIAKQLVDKVIQSTKNLHELRVSCRRDYNLEKFWVSNGFVAKSDRPGRSKDGHLITEWILDFGHPNLFNFLNQEILDSKLCVVIDANIFLDLTDSNPTRNTEDSKVLLSDWLSDEAELFLTDEIFNDLNRIEDSQQRNLQRNAVSQFNLLRPKQEDVDTIKQKIRHYFPKNLTSQDISDLGHLSRAIASNSRCFITRDGELLKLDSLLYQSFNLSVLRPSDFIIYLDELLRGSQYQPFRFSGTALRIQRIQTGQQDALCQAFLNFKAGEKSITFKSQLREYISNPQNTECLYIKDDATQDLVALLIFYNNYQEKELGIPLFRINESLIISSTLAEHLLLLITKKAQECESNFIKITDKYLSSSTKKACLSNQFFFDSERVCYLKCSFNLADKSKFLSNRLQEVLRNSRKEYEYSFTQAALSILNSSIIVKNPSLAIEVERLFYPLKITDSDVPSFIIPIQPKWAEALFDEELALLNIFGVPPELAFRREMIYYRSARQNILKAPGRILWYVSYPKPRQYYPNIMSIRACSYLDEVIIDKAEHIYKQFRRFGVYKKEDVLETAQSHSKRHVMALRFSDTQLASKPIPFKDIREVLAPKKVPFVAPFRISSEEFENLYKKGFQA